MINSMTRMIRDSDDESDCLSPLKLREDELQVLGSRDSGGEKVVSHSESTSSTGSHYKPHEIQWS